MLIVEGPDGVGKTTFCKKLLAGLPTHVYAHFTRLPPMFDPYWGYADRASRFIVQDRFHMSEVVYAAACRRSTILPPEEYRLIDAQLRLLGSFTVLITAELELVAERWDQSQMFSKELTVEAARLFLTASVYDDSFDPYVSCGLDIDYDIHCDRSKPYPDDRDVTTVLEMYRRRQRVLDAAGGRRPASLQTLGVL